MLIFYIVGIAHRLLPLNDRRYPKNKHSMLKNKQYAQYTINNVSSCCKTIVYNYNGNN